MESVLIDSGLLMVLAFAFLVWMGVVHLVFLVAGVRHYMDGKRRRWVTRDEARMISSLRKMRKAQREAARVDAKYERMIDRQAAKEARG